MNKTKTKTGLIIAMSILVMCMLAVPAIAKNVTDAECGVCFGAMPPEITEMQIPGLKEASMSLKGGEEVVIWQDDFSTNPFNGRWDYWALPQAEMGWDGGRVYLPYEWGGGYYTCAQTMYHSFSTNNPFYGYYNPKVEYRFKSYSDNGEDAAFKVAFVYEHNGGWCGDSQFYYSPEEYSSWTTKNLGMSDFWTHMDSEEEYRVFVYEDADYSHYPHGGSCDPWEEVKGHVTITYIKLIGTPNEVPYQPSNPSPAAYGAAGASTTTYLSWTGGDPNGDDTVKYNVYMGTSPSSLNLICENISSTTCYTGMLDAYKTYHWKVVALDEFGLTNEGDIWSFYMYATRLTIDSPAEGDTPVIHKDDDGDSYISFSGTVIPEEDTGSGCLVKVYGPSDQFLGEWCTHQTLSAGEPYAFSIRVYVHNATLNLTGENTLAAYWMRGDPLEVTTTVTVDLPSDYMEVVCGYVGNVPVCLSPEHIEMLKEMKAEAERQMQRDDINDEALSTLSDVTTSIDLLLSLEENPGAKISAKALKILTIFQAAHQTKETGGSFYDFIKRCTNEFAIINPFFMPVMELCWEWDLPQTSRHGPLDTWGFVPAWGFMEAGVGATGEDLPANYYKNWRIGPYMSILGGPISGIMVKLDYVYMGTGDYFTIYEGDYDLIPVWESTPGVRHVDVKRAIPDEIGRIIVDCDDSGADSYGFKFDPECAIYLMCHHAEYYNYNGTGAHLVKLGTETTELNFSWGAGSPYPEVNAENFMAVWSGQIYIPGNDTYTFYVASENGTVDVKINCTELLSNCIFDDPAEANNSTYLYEGWHNFVVWYHHTIGNASFVLSWENSTMGKQVIPDENTRTSRTELVSLPMTAFFSYKVPEFSNDVSFTDLSLGDNITEWEWNFGDGTPDEAYTTSTNPFHNYTEVGFYEVSLTVTNSTGATSIHSETINVNVPPVTATKEVVLPGVYETIGVVEDHIYTVKVYAVNNGIAPSNPGTLNLYANGDYIGSESLPAIPAGTIELINFSWTPLTPGTYNLTSNVSSSQDIAFVDVPVDVEVFSSTASERNLTISDLKLDPDYGDRPSEIHAKVEVTNPGTADKTGILSVYLYDSEDQPIYSNSTPITIPPMTRNRYDLLLSAEMPVSGSYKASALIDGVQNHHASIIGHDCSGNRFGYIRHTVHLPENAKNLSYNIKYWVDCSMYPHIEGTFGVRIKDANGSVLKEINETETFCRWLCCKKLSTFWCEHECSSEGWVKRSMDISSFAGQDIVVEIFNENSPEQGGMCKMNVDNIIIDRTLFIDGDFESGGWTIDKYTDGWCGESMIEVNPEVAGEIEKNYHVSNAIVVKSNGDFDKLLYDPVLPNGSIVKVGDTYYIQNLEVEKGVGRSICIENTSVPFVIRNCTIQNICTFFENYNLDEWSGVYFYNVSNGTIEDNTIQHVGHGITIQKSTYVDITNNTIQYNADDGILIYPRVFGPLQYLDDSKFINIISNTIKDNWYSGIELIGSNCTVKANTIQNNTVYGTYVHGNDSVICNNAIKYNGDYGIKLYNSSGNYIFWNDFIGNNQ